MRVELPSGGSAEITDLNKLKGKHRSAVQSHIGTATKISDDGSIDRSQFGPVMATIDNAIISMLVESWELPYEPGAPTPFNDPQWLDKIDVDDHAALEAATEPHRAKLLLRRTGKEPEVRSDGSPDPASPTLPAAEPSTVFGASTSPKHSVMSNGGGTA